MNYESSINLNANSRALAYHKFAQAAFELWNQYHDDLQFAEQVKKTKILKQEDFQSFYSRILQNDPLIGLELECQIAKDETK